MDEHALEAVPAPHDGGAADGAEERSRDPVDLAQLTEKVYRLLREELRLEGTRGAGIVLRGGR